MIRRRVSSLMPHARVLDLEADAIAVGQPVPSGVTEVGLREASDPRAHGDGARTLADRLDRVRDETHQDQTHLARIGLHRRKAGGESPLEGHVSRQRGPHQAEHLVRQRRQVDTLHHHARVAGIRLELATEIAGSARRLLDLQETRPCGAGLAQLSQPEVHAAPDGHHQVAELVGDASGEDAQALAPLRLEHLGLELELCPLRVHAAGDVAPEEEQRGTARAVDHAAIDLDRHDRAVLASMQAVEEDDLAPEHALDLLVHRDARPGVGEERERLAGDLIGGEAGDAAGGFVHVSDGEVGGITGVDQQHGIVQTIAHRMKELFALPQRPLDADPPVGLHGQRDEVAHRSRERLLLGGPLPWRADVFVAYDAADLAAQVERGVQERHDTARSQIGGELASPRIAERVECGDRAKLRQSRDVRWSGGSEDLVALRVPTRASLIAFEAAKTRVAPCRMSRC